jgi:hypothetical protein
MTIGTTGNVGIGTTAPAEKLHVLGGKVLFGDAADATGAVGNGDLTLRAYRTPQIHISANNSSGVFYGLNIELNNNIYAGLLLNLSSGEVKIGALAATYFPTFYSNNIERMRIDTAGNVGIGTTAPSSKLHVAETWNNAGTTFCAIKSVITDTNSAAGSDFLELYAGSATQPLKLDIQKTGQMNIYGAWTDTSNYERLSFSAPTAANAVIGTNKAGTGTARGLEFQTDGVTRAGITNAGLTVIGRGFTGLKVGCSDIAGNDAVVDIAGSGSATITGRASGSYGWASGTIAGHSGRDTALFRHSAGVVEINNGTLGSFRDLRVRSVIQQPPASITPASNGDYVVEATNDTTLTFRLKGSDGTVRSATLTLAP